MSDYNDDFDVFDSYTGEIPPDEDLTVSELMLGSVDEFVREQLMPDYMRVVGPRYQRRWAADWWRYPEAVSRLDALWRSWESARHDPTAMSSWWRVDVDHHIPVLMSSEGPFANSEDRNEPGQPLPYTAPPPSMFPDLRA